MDRQYEKRKQMVYQFICDEFYVPMKLKEMASILQVKREERQQLKEMLDELESEGKIHRTQKGNYIKGQGNRLTGVYQAHARGFGFVCVEGSDSDVFIPEEESGGALQGDEVENSDYKRSRIQSGTPSGRKGCKDYQAGYIPSGRILSEE